jgi:hypothetical protein
MTSGEPLARRLNRQDNDIASLYELVTEVREDVRTLARTTDERFAEVRGDIRALSDRTDQRFEAVDQRFDGVDATLQLILQRLDER